MSEEKGYRPEICPICRKKDCPHDMRDIMHYLRNEKKAKKIYTCNCLSESTEKPGMCPACGKLMCDRCTDDNGKHKGWVCWKPGRLKIRRHPGGNTCTVYDTVTGEYSTATF